MRSCTESEMAGQTRRQRRVIFLAQSFRAKLLAELPKSKQEISGNMLSFVYRAKGMLRELATINFEIAQMTVASDKQESLPDWFMMEVIRDLPNWFIKLIFIVQERKTIYQLLPTF